jgi:hypothetical protein
MTPTSILTKFANGSREVHTHTHTGGGAVVSLWFMEYEEVFAITGRELLQNWSKIEQKGVGLGWVGLVSETVKGEQSRGGLDEIDSLCGVRN